MSSTPPAPDADPAAPALLHLRTWLEPGLDEGFSEWCDGHHADQLSLPGFRRVRRWSLVRSVAPEPPDYLTVYDLDRLDVLESDAYAAHRERATGLPDFLKGRLRAARSDAWLVASVPPGGGATSGGSAVAHLFVEDGPDLAGWFTERGPAVVEAAGGTSARLLRSTTGEQILVVDREDGADGLDPASLPAPDGLDDLEGSDAVGWGLYRLDHVATPDGPLASPHRDRRNAS